MWAVVESWRLLAQGLLVTLAISAATVALGTVIGGLGGLVLLYGALPLRWLWRVYVDVVRGIPQLVLIFAIYYLLPVVGINVPAVVAGVAALSLFAGAHMSEIARGAIGSIPRGQHDAARALGLAFWGRLRWVVLPLALPRAIPPWVNTVVEMVKGSALVSLVSIVDLLFAAQKILERTGQAMPLYLTLCVVYFLINFGISRLGGMLERRFAYKT